jgi:hypothetical protein
MRPSETWNSRIALLTLYVPDEYHHTFRPFHNDCYRTEQGARHIIPTFHGGPYDEQDS